MSPLEIISRLCDVTENLSAIVKKQQTIIEQSKIEEAVRTPAGGRGDRQGDGCSRISHAEILRHRRHRGDRVRKGERR